MHKILVANRGEIACRVLRTINKLGFQSVAIYSEADVHSKHITIAHESYCVGPPPSKESYLNIDKILEVCKTAGVTMIHPGYGFLSENSTFAERVTQAGIIFIGPGKKAIEMMGSKLAAKEAVSNYDIPMVPGTDHAIESAEEALKIAEGIGYPILIKASAGGGGKGMRIVNSSSELADQMQMAISEATSSFGDGSVFIEKFVTNPRHIEIQILADNHGNVLHLNERDCSIQRRHQKVVEEAPSAVLTPGLRQKMGEAAARVAMSCDYSGAGTVEFLLDSELNFYFLEMNTRLQVEHPVTELITGIDLVEQQIHVALDKVLELKQEDIGIHGHSIELRVYAEDPLNNFLPDIGTIHKYRIPTESFIRVDDAFEEGDSIPIYYDPMISKLIVWGEDRKQAIERMKFAIANYEIEGIATTLEFGSFAMNHEAFISGEFDTNFVKLYFNENSRKEQEGTYFEAASALMGALRKEKSQRHIIIEN